ncbi:TlpA family protein disulfide reductase [Actinocatenispora rupis]|uniref:TlpA family protein disulfide reductase n=1 Tax=Actinocatenispora rupis TaxID=519421 RepID=UPI001EF3052B|nr:thioredoxin family protein [Actinocatenispora rupis]
MPNWAVGALVAAVVLAAATAFGLFWRGREGRFRPTAAAKGATVPASSTDATPTAPVPAGDGAEVEVLTGLGVQPGTPATLVQFSSAFCAPCRATRRLCDELTGLLDGVRHIEVDAESHLDAVRALDIMRTPTLLVVDRDGRIVQRASGLPTKPHLIAAVAPLLDADPAVR